MSDRNTLRSPDGYYYVRFGIGSRDAMVDWWAHRKRSDVKCSQCWQTIACGTVCIAHYVGFREPTETWCLSCAKTKKPAARYLDFDAGPDFGTLPQ